MHRLLLLLVSVFLLGGCAVTQDRASDLAGEGAMHVPADNAPRLMGLCQDGEYVGKNINDFPKDLKCESRKGGGSVCKLAYFYSKETSMTRTWYKQVYWLHADEQGNIFGCAGNSATVLHGGLL